MMQLWKAVGVVTESERNVMCGGGGKKFKFKKFV